MADKNKKTMNTLQKKVIFDNMADDSIKYGALELSKKMKKIRIYSDNFIYDIDLLNKKTAKEILEYFTDLYANGSFMHYEAMILDKKFSWDNMRKAKISFESNPRNKLIKETFIFYSLYRRLLHSLQDLLDEAGKYDFQGNSNNIMNIYFDYLFKNLKPMQEMISKKTDNFFSAPNLKSFKSVNYGNDAARVLLYPIEAQGKEMGYTGKNLYHYVRDNLISQGYLFHAFNNSYIKDNIVLDSVLKYEIYLFNDFVRLCDLNFGGNKNHSIWHRGFMLIESLVWAGISGTEVSDLFKFSTYPLGFIPVISMPYRAAKNIRQKFLKEKNGNDFSTNSETNRNSLREMVLRNIKYFNDEYIAFESAYIAKMLSDKIEK